MKSNCWYKETRFRQGTQRIRFHKRGCARSFKPRSEVSHYFPLSLGKMGSFFLSLLCKVWQCEFLMLQFHCHHYFAIFSISHFSWCKNGFCSAMGNFLSHCHVVQNLLQASQSWNLTFHFVLSDTQLERKVFFVMGGQTYANWSWWPKHLASLPNIFFLVMPLETCLRSWGV